MTQLDAAEYLGAGTKKDIIPDTRPVSGVVGKVQILSAYCNPLIDHSIFPNREGADDRTVGMGKEKARPNLARHRYFDSEEKKVDQRKHFGERAQRPTMAAMRKPMKQHRRKSGRQHAEP
ncbi:hypothetical protein ACQZ2F_23130 [Pseudomonas lurida]|uniref:hypothetical protein n=1 Tax=Pseudomonas lurida TaxID=244566 RepID=UPI003D2D5086